MEGHRASRLSGNLCYSGCGLARLCRAVLLCFFEKVRSLKAKDQLRAVIADRLDWAAFLGFLAAGFFFRALWLFVDERITTVIVAFEIVRSGFPA